MRRDQGFIVALVKFSADVSSEEALNIDPIFTDQPQKTEHHWVVEDTIDLIEPIPYSPNVSWTRISESPIKKVLKDILDTHGEIQPVLPQPQVKLMDSCFPS